MVASLVAAAVLVVYGLVADVRMGRVRRRIAQMTGAGQRRAEVVRSLGSRSRRDKVRIQLQGGGPIDLLRVRDER
ncbi:MAG TPA: hypothetical protein VFX70_23035 [Mycobacteriales bacterium]|nr:hypothetical protein [Mycobacteriales bacterium]